MTKFFFPFPSLLSDFARPVVNHPPTDWVERGYVRLCCVGCAMLVEVRLGMDVGAMLTEVMVKIVGLIELRYHYKG